MLSKDLTANPKAVNIIRPLHQQQQQQHNIFSPQFQQQLNFSTSTNSSSCTFSTASTTTINTIHTSTTTSPMIRQPSAESNPGLSFFCQASPTNNHTILKSNINQHQKTLELKQQQQQQHQPQQPPLVISRINLSNFNRRPTITSDLDQSITEPVEEDEAEPEDEEEEDDDYDDLDMYVLDDLDEEEEPDEQPTPEITPNNSRIASTFKPGFGIMSGGLGSFLLRGTMAQPKPQVDEARVHRKIEDLEIEKKSLLTLNQTLETVVKEQSNTISDLQNRLAAIERPLTPGLDTTSSKNGIMSTTVEILDPSELERYMEDEDAAYNRIRAMLVELIEQAQTAISENKKMAGRVITDYDAHKTSSNMKRSNTVPNGGRPRSVIGDRSTGTRNSLGVNQQNVRVARRISLGNTNHNVSTTTHTSSRGRLLSSSPSTTFTSPSTSPIPNRRASMQRSLSRSSSHATLSSSPNGAAPTPRASKYSKKSTSQNDTTTTRKWLN